MNPRTILLAVVALSLAGLTALFARQWLDAQRAVVVAAPVEAPAPKVEVLVAREALPAGTFVKPEHLQWLAWPEGGTAQSYVIKGKGDINAFVGAVVRQFIAPGEPVTSARVVTPGDRGFLAAVLQPGMRAVSVSITAETGISGLVFPGDRIDLILAQGFREGNSEQTQMRRASETVLNDIRVVAIDQNTKDQNDKPAVGKTVTFEVTPKQAEVVAVAAELGKLSLSLRSLATPEDPPARHVAPTWDSDISQVANRSGATDEISVMHGAKLEAVPIKTLATKASVIRGALK